MLDFDLDYKTVIAAALVGAVAIWAAKKGAAAAIETATEAAKAVNPVNEGNIFNRAFNSLYQGLTGSEQPLGADVYDWTHTEIKSVEPPTGEVGLQSPAVTSSIAPEIATPESGLIKPGSSLAGELEFLTSFDF